MNPSTKNDAIVVIDVESTCWQGEPPAGEHSEIIEIGVCLLDLTTFERSAKKSLLVRPTRSKVSAFCTDLTTIRPEDVAGAPILGDAIRVLIDEYATRERRWASYGDYDRKQFAKNCAERGIPYPFSSDHTNVKTTAAAALHMTKKLGMAGMLRQLGLPLEGTHHRGADDAWNIAAILATILRRHAR